MNSSHKSKDIDSPTFKSRSIGKLGQLLKQIQNDDNIGSNIESSDIDLSSDISPKSITKKSIKQENSFPEIKTNIINETLEDESDDEIDPVFYSKSLLDNILKSKKYKTKVLKVNSSYFKPKESRFDLDFTEKVKPPRLIDLDKIKVRRENTINNVSINTSQLKGKLK